MAKHKPRGVSSGVRRPNPQVKGVGSAKRAAARPTGTSRAVDWASGETAKDEVERTQSPYMEEAIELARNGDDSFLLPYQPTPSSNPPRPRTLAAGYDSRTKTMRIRFRDGTGYEYYDVPPRVWNNFKRVKSPGRAVNRYFGSGQYKYSRASW